MERSANDCPEWFNNAAEALLGEGTAEDLEWFRDHFRQLAELDGEKYGQWYSLCERAIEIGHGPANQA